MTEESSAGPCSHAKQGTWFSFCCAQNKNRMDDKGTFLALCLLAVARSRLVADFAPKISWRSNEN